MFLVDANIWFESLLGRSRSQEADQFLARVPMRHQFITDMQVHSVGIGLRRYHRMDLWSVFLDNIEIDPPIQVLTLALAVRRTIPTVMSRFDLDFEDSYQYLVSQEYGLKSVSFDTDFDRTDRGRLTPAQALAMYSQSHSYTAMPLKQRNEP